MKIIEHGFYIIDDKFFEDFPDPYLKGNKEQNRPHYYCLKDEGTGIYWIIPLSSKIDKFKRIVEKHKELNKPCDKIHIMKIAGKENAFLIQDIFPVTEQYISREYTINNIHSKLLDEKPIKEIERKAKKILYLIRKGIKLMPTQPDVLKIEEQLKTLNIEKNLIQESISKAAATKEICPSIPSKTSIKEKLDSLKNYPRESSKAPVSPDKEK